jgi:hypothetical protein
MVGGTRGELLRDTSANGPRESIRRQGDAASQPPPRLTPSRPKSAPRCDSGVVARVCVSRRVATAGEAGTQAVTPGLPMRHSPGGGWACGPTGPPRARRPGRPCSVLKAARSAAGSVRVGDQHHGPSPCWGSGGRWSWPTSHRRAVPFPAQFSRHPQPAVATPAEGCLSPTPPPSLPRGAPPNSLSRRRRACVSASHRCFFAARDGQGRRRVGAEGGARHQEVHREGGAEALHRGRLLGGGSRQG